MKVLIDANVIITYISGREDRYSSEAEQIMQLCAEEKIEGIIAFHTLSVVWYVSRRLPDEDRREWLWLLCTMLTVSSADQNSIKEAIDDTAFADFEDALQDRCAVEAEADFLVTANIKHFAEMSKTPAVTPEQFLNYYYGIQQ